MGKDAYPNTVVTTTLKLPYKYTAGKTLSQFFVALRDEGKILGKACPQCDTVLFPPRTTCGRCHGKTGDWVELTGTGVLETFTVIHYEEPTLPEKPPYILGQIRLDGCNGGITHLVKGIREEDVRAGMRLRARIREEREGNILDIEGFVPLGGRQD